MNKLVLLPFLIIILVATDLKSFEPETSMSKKCKETSSENCLMLDLDTAILIGATNNIMLKTIDAKKEVFKMLVTEKWREFLPKVGISYFGLRNIGINAPDTIYNDVRLTIQQLVFDGGEVSLQLETAKLQEVLNEQEFKINYSKLKLEIQKTYMKALFTRGKIFLNQRALESANDSFRLTKTELRSGFSNKLKLLELAGKVRQVEYSYQKAVNEHNQALYDLKQILNLDYKVGIELKENLFLDFVLNPPIVKLDQVLLSARTERNEIKKSQIVIGKLKNEKELAENYWLPKFYIGGYVGRNGTDFPLRHDEYGVNFTLAIPFGSNTTQTTGNLGVQKDGNGIQRYPGYGNQFVGQGTNGYNQSNINFFDNLSYSRKIVEGKILLSEAILTHQSLENQIAIEVNKNLDKMKENWELIRVANSRVHLQFENLKIVITRFEVGHSRRIDVLGAQLEFVKAQEDLAESLTTYMVSGYELFYSANLNSDPYRLILYNKGNGNSLIARLFYSNINYLKSESVRNLWNLKNSIKSKKEKSGENDIFKDSGVSE